MGDAFLRFDLVLGVAVGDGVGEIFFRFGVAVGEGLGVGFFVERFRCLRGTGVGVAKIFLIFVPNESSAALPAWTVPISIATIRNHRNIVWETSKLVGRFCETPSEPASDTDALQFWFPIG